MRTYLIALFLHHVGATPFQYIGSTRTGSWSQSGNDWTYPGSKVTLTEWSHKICIPCESYDTSNLQPWDILRVRRDEACDSCTAGNAANCAGMVFCYGEHVYTKLDDPDIITASNNFDIVFDLEFVGTGSDTLFFYTASDSFNLDTSPYSTLTPYTFKLSKRGHTYTLYEGSNLLHTATSADAPQVWVRPWGSQLAFKEITGEVIAIQYPPPPPSPSNPSPLDMWYARYVPGGPESQGQYLNADATSCNSRCTCKQTCEYNGLTATDTEHLRTFCEEVKYLSQTFVNGRASPGIMHVFADIEAKTGLTCQDDSNCNYNALGYSNEWNNRDCIASHSNQGTPSWWIENGNLICKFPKYESISHLNCNTGHHRWKWGNEFGSNGPPWQTKYNPVCLCQPVPSPPPPSPPSSPPPPLPPPSPPSPPPPPPALCSGSNVYCVSDGYTNHYGTDRWPSNRRHLEGLIPNSARITVAAGTAQGTLTRVNNGEVIGPFNSDGQFQSGGNPIHGHLQGNIVTHDSANTGCTGNDNSYADAVANGCPRILISFNCLNIREFSILTGLSFTQSMANRFYAHLKPCHSGTYVPGRTFADGRPRTQGGRSGNGNRFPHYNYKGNNGGVSNLWDSRSQYDNTNNADTWDINVQMAIDAVEITMDGPTTMNIQEVGWDLDTNVNLARSRARAGG